MMYTELGIDANDYSFSLFMNFLFLLGLTFTGHHIDWAYMHNTEK